MNLHSQSINQSEAELFSVGDHVRVHFSNLRRFSVSVTHTKSSQFVSSSNIFSRSYPLLPFPSINLDVTNCSICSFFYQMLGIDSLAMTFKSDGAGLLLVAVFLLISLPPMRCILFHLRIICLLPPISFVIVLNCPVLASIHQDWINVAIQGAFSCMNGDAFIC